MQLFTHSFGFILLGLVCVSLGQPDDPSEGNIFQEDESYLLEGDYDTVHGGSKFMLSPSDSSSHFQGAETFSRPVIIVSGRNLKDQVGHKEKRIVPSRSRYDDEEEENEERPVIVETRKKKKRVDQPISAYVPTAYVIGNQGGEQSTSRVKQGPVEKEQEYGIMVVSPKHPINENYQLINAANYPGVNEEMLDRNTIQLYQEPQIVEALSVDGQNEIKEITGDDKDESLDTQKSKLTLLFLGYEKF